MAATGRKRFPNRKTVTDREAFERFLEATHFVRLSVEYHGQCYLIERIFYKWFRCQLVHEDELPIDIEFIPDAESGELSVRAGGSPDFTLKVAEGWIHFLVGAVVAASENKGLFQS